MREPDNKSKPVVALMIVEAGRYLRKKRYKFIRLTRDLQVDIYDKLMFAGVRDFKMRARAAGIFEGLLIGQEAKPEAEKAWILGEKGEPLALAGLAKYLGAKGLVVSRKDIEEGVKLLVKAEILALKPCDLACGKPVRFPVSWCEKGCEKKPKKNPIPFKTEKPKDISTNKNNDNIISITETEEDNYVVGEGRRTQERPGGHRARRETIEWPGDLIRWARPAPPAWIPVVRMFGLRSRRRRRIRIRFSVIRSAGGAGRGGKTPFSLNENQDDERAKLGLFHNEYWLKFEAMLGRIDLEKQDPRILLNYDLPKCNEHKERVLIMMANKWFTQLFPGQMMAENRQGKSDRTTIFGDDNRAGMFELAYEAYGPKGVIKAIEWAQKTSRKLRDPHPLKNPMGFFVKRIKEMVGNEINRSS